MMTKETANPHRLDFKSFNFIVRNKSCRFHVAGTNLSEHTYDSKVGFEVFLIGMCVGERLT
jgi:hypothetical protein